MDVIHSINKEIIKYEDHNKKLPRNILISKNYFLCLCEMIGISTNIDLLSEVEIKFMGLNFYICIRNNVLKIF